MKQEIGFLVDEAGKKLQVKPMVMCQTIPFVETQDGNIPHFAGGKMENIYHADDRYFNFLGEQVVQAAGAGPAEGRWLASHQCQSHWNLTVLLIQR